MAKAVCNAFCPINVDAPRPEQAACLRSHQTSPLRLLLKLTSHGAMIGSTKAIGG